MKCYQYNLTTILRYPLRERKNLNMLLTLWANIVSPRNRRSGIGIAKTPNRLSIKGFTRLFIKCIFIFTKTIIDPHRCVIYIWSFWIMWWITGIVVVIGSPVLYICVELKKNSTTGDPVDTL